MDVKVAAGAAVVVSKYEEGHEPGWAGLQPPGMLVATGVAAEVDLGRAAIWEAHHSRMRAASSP